MNVDVEMTTELKDAEKKEVVGSEKDLDIVKEEKREGKEEEKGETAAVIEMSTVESETAIKNDEISSVTVADNVTDTTTVAPVVVVAVVVAPAMAASTAVVAPTATAVAVTAAAAPKMPVLPVRVKPVTPTVLLCSMVSYLQSPYHITSYHVMSCHVCLPTIYFPCYCLFFFL